MSRISECRRICELFWDSVKVDWFIFRWEAAVSLTSPDPSVYAVALGAFIIIASALGTE